MKNSAKKPLQPYWRQNSSLNFSIGLVLSLTLVITAFEWNFKSELTDKPIDFTSHDIDVPDMVIVHIPSPPKPLSPPDPSEIIETKTPPVQAVKPVLNIPIEQSDGSETAPDLSSIINALEPGKEATTEAIYELIPAEPIGGKEAFYEYLHSRIHYPAHLVSSSKAGKVVVKFEVDKKGKITNIKILEGFDKALEKEIIRVLKASPAWKPAKMGPETVSTSLAIPFSFDLR